MNSITKKNVFIHTAGWLLILLVNMIFIDNYAPKSSVALFNVPVWTIYISIFYINYSLLIPRYLLRKKTLKYILYSLLVLSVTFVAMKSYLQMLRVVDLKEKLEQVELNGDVDMKDPNPKPWNQGMNYTEILRNNIETSFDIDKYYPFHRHNMPLLYVILLIFSSSIIMKLFQGWKKDEQAKIEMDRARIESELEYLKQQINPHFLFNALNSIYSLTLPHSSVASDSILKLSSILRYMLYQTDKEMVSLTDEVAIIEDYIGLHKLRLTPKTTVVFNKKGIASSYNIEPLLLIPFVENAFKFGVDSSKESRIEISVSVEDNNIVLETVNDIMITKTDNKNSGLGIKNICRRLDLKYKDVYSFSHFEKDNKFFVYLSIPLKK